MAEPLRGPSTYGDLWLAWRAGDPSAFETLYRDLSPGLHAYCRSLVRGTTVSADDLFQEAFRRAISAAAQYRPEGGSLSAWLSTIVRNAFLDRIRRESRGPEPLPPDPILGGGERRGDGDLLDSLAALPGIQREALALRYLQGLSLSETAGVLEVSLATAKRRITEGLERLRKSEKA